MSHFLTTSRPGVDCFSIACHIYLTKVLIYIFKVNFSKECLCNTMGLKSHTNFLNDLNINLCNTMKVRKLQNVIFFEELKCKHKKSSASLCYPKDLYYLLYFDDALNFFYVMFEVIFRNIFADFLCYFRLKCKNHAKSY